MGESGWGLVVGVVTVALVVGYLWLGIGIVLVFAALTAVAAGGRLLMRLGGGGDPQA